MQNGRKRTATVVAISAAALTGSLLISSPVAAEPDIEDVKARVAKLYHEAEQASERYNDVRLELQASEDRLETLRADLARQEARVDESREQVAALVVEQYQGQALSTTAQVALSEDTDAFLAQLATVSAVNDQQLQLMESFATEADRLELREEAARRELAAIAEVKETLADEKAEIDEKAAEAEELLSRLEAKEQARIAHAHAPSRSGSRAPVVASNVPVSGRAGAAVSYALAQVGDAYVYGATGEGAFDCSGLTMRAWAQAGVSLPHSSSAQMSMGTPVSSSDLQPGDLVFYYSPVSHVGIYIGNGRIVHAANPSTGVQITGVFSMPLSGARRPG